jgi:hypothetical protein
MATAALLNTKIPTTWLRAGQAATGRKVFEASCQRRIDASYRYHS